MDSIRSFRRAAVSAFSFFVLGLAPGLVGLTGLAGLAGCAGGGNSTTDFGRSINKIQPGMTQSQVREELGRPKKVFTGVVMPGNPSDPSAPVVGRVPGGSRYERWFYTQGDTHYHVYFGRSMTRPGQWEVAKVVANPAAAAVAGTNPPPSVR